MVTILNTGLSIGRILTYNEKKVRIGTAQCIAAANFPVDLHQLTYDMKLMRFKARTMLNNRSIRNAVHITVNFSPLEKLSKEKLITIINVYMDKIGFGNQPYLVYQHFDSAHPHLHVVSTKILRNGQLMDMYHLVKLKGEPARKEIEELFGLIKAKGRKNHEEFILNSSSPLRIQYGKMESRKSINHVLHHVLNQYKYTNLQDLNAVLSQYNLKAWISSENSKTGVLSGLYFTILNGQKKNIGMYINGSDLYNKPTLAFLENQFKINILSSTQTKARLKKNVEIALFRVNYLPDLIKTLNKQGINTVLQRNTKGDIDQITYIDLRTKSIYHDHALSTLNSTRLIQEGITLKTSTANQQISSLRKQPRISRLHY